MEDERNWGPSPFRFVNAWTLHPEFILIAQKAWSERLVQGWAGYRVQRKLGGLKEELKRWNIEVFGVVEEQLKKAEEDLHALELLAESRVLEPNEVACRREAKDLVWTLRKKKAWIWFQKSRLNWAENGDRNTKYFHIITSKRQRRNLINSVVINGLNVDDPELVWNEVLRHYLKAFAEDWPSRPKLSGNFVPIDYARGVAILEPEFTLEEVWEVVKECDGNKALGPDGFNMACIQKCWKFMKTDIFKVMQEFYQHNKLVKGLNSSFITLIPKKFADDTILFCEAEWEEIVNVKRILRCFEVMSGLKINFHESVVCGVGVSDTMVHDFTSTLHCLCQKLPLKYLGLPLGANP
ncbi:uncharacterized protein LOC114288382 [Camellia sinensis]|uniref:uncharacterized protein LOC114288382 n=1 Tax=Camellia sinensis TaxID=4442 RepID=UPI0010366736|nr:uncharacterized protein LOC114288382 [Camellia sinensis]